MTANQLRFFLRRRLQRFGGRMVGRKVLAMIACLGFGFSAYAAHAETWPDENRWLYAGETGGVAVYWRYRHELADQVIAELKYENRNSFAVDVTGSSHFMCRDGTDFTGSENLVSLRAGQTKGGQYEGMADYPCKGSRPPSRGGYTMTVKRTN